MAGTVPRGVAGVPAHDAAEVAASCREPVRRSVGVAALGDLAEPVADDVSLARLERALARPAKATGHEPGADVDILRDEVVQGGAYVEPGRREHAQALVRVPGQRSGEQL